MENNTTISERISQLIDCLGVNPNSFAKKLGYDRSQALYDIINGKSKPSFDFFQKLYSSEYSELVNMNWLVTGKGEKFVQNKNNDRLVLNEPEEVYGLNNSDYVTNLIKSLAMKDEIIALYREKLQAYESKGSTESRLSELEEFTEVIKFKLKLDLEIKNTKKRIVTKKKMP